ncbi:hypothetical protein C474_01976 [Halogeometricum pallidum JCM 14848]|uniref:DUF7999 domain-containing protein n=2 Tax=Halogeometricum TaxID=60846 RepID=M0DG49_HALPD|nr:hypothetical protein C474_01976 [Halogeometricum pallidum JCM 14848]
MNDHGAMTVRVEASNEVRQIVECESDAVKHTLARLPTGATVPLKMESLGSRGNAWRVTELVGVDHAQRPTAPRRDDARPVDEDRDERDRRVRV